MLGARAAGPRGICIPNLWASVPRSQPLSPDRQLVLHRFAERFPARVDDVLADADGTPDLTAITTFDQHPRPRARAAVALEDTHLVIAQLHVAELWIVFFQRQAQR